MRQVTPRYAIVMVGLMTLLAACSSPLDAPQGSDNTTAGNDDGAPGSETSRPRTGSVSDGANTSTTIAPREGATKPLKWIPQPGLYTLETADGRRVSDRVGPASRRGNNLVFSVKRRDGSSSDGNRTYTRALTSSGVRLLLAEEFQVTKSHYEEDEYKGDSVSTDRCTRKPPVIELKFPLTVGQKWSMDRSGCEEEESQTNTFLGKSYAVTDLTACRFGTARARCAEVKGTTTYEGPGGQPYVVRTRSLVTVDFGVTVHLWTERPSPTGEGVSKEEVRLVAVKLDPL